MSYLTTPQETLEAEVIAALEGEGFAYDPLRHTWPQYLATVLGDPTAYLFKSIAQMLSEIDAQYGGSLSHLRASIAQLLDDVAANIGAGGGGGGGEEEDDMTIATVNISSAQILNMHVTPITLIAAPGAGKMLRLVRGQYFLLFGTTPYAGGDFCGMFYTQSNNEGSSDPNYIRDTEDGLFDMLQKSIDSNVYVAPAGAQGDGGNMFVNTITENAPIVLADGVAWTDGDGTLVARLVYETLDIPS